MPVQHLFLPTSREEMLARGWDSVDVVFVTGDAYVDHYSFAMAILGRVLEDHVHARDIPRPGLGYRPARPSARRRPR